MIKIDRLANEIDVLESFVNICRGLKFNGDWYYLPETEEDKFS